MPALHATLSFLSAALLFVVQPLFGRLALPVLGGSPQVWATTLVFFQAALLGGYFYAHALQRVSVRVQGLVHVGALLAGASFLPLHLATSSMPSVDAPATWLLATLAASVGMPFVVLAAHAPLLQRWYAARFPGRDPYPLYVASNAGSLTGLLGYPFVLEPALTLSQQARAWTAGYALLAAGVLLAVHGLRRSATVAAASEDPQPVARAGSLLDAPEAATPSPRAWAAWIAYAAVPSALLVTVTTQITTDFAALPMMWVPPLALYLVTFMFAFAARPRVAPPVALRIGTVALIALAALAYAVPARGALPYTFAVLAAFFAAALALHVELVRRRPAPAHLTKFYLAMSLGGALGGAAAALLPPLVFAQAHERPVILVAAAVLVALAAAREPGRPAPSRVIRWLQGLRARPLADLGFALLCAALVGSYVLARRQFAGTAELVLAGLAALAIAAAAYAARRRPARAAVAFAALLLAAGGWRLVADTGTAWRGRSFHGSYRVVVNPERRMLLHGTTLHGAQSAIDYYARTPMTYYGPASGAGAVLATTAARTVGVVGLGTGAMACWARPGQRWTFFEIDPLMVHLARDTGLFTYLRECTPDARIVLGDARLTLAREPAGSYDLIAIDAFSSDAIPLHLLTAEAFASYRARLATGGQLLVHVSNRHLDLVPVVAAVARAQRWRMRTKQDAGNTRPGLYFTPSTWIWLAAPEMAAPGAAGWEPWPQDRPLPRVWTDDYANPLVALKRHR
jgi:hypothetical protein